MRLINVKTGILEEFWSGEKPKYAILSHTWGLEEVSFVDVQRFAARQSGQVVYEPQAAHLPGFDTPQLALVQRPIESKAGYRKIKMACQQAEKDGLEYIWIDTSVARSAPQLHAQYVELVLGAVSTNLAQRSFPKPSILCTIGTEMLI